MKPDDLAMPQDWGDDDVCNHCGATWDESVRCPMNGCPFGREEPNGTIEAADDDGSSR